MFAGNLDTQHAGVPVRPPATANLLIDSEDRYATLAERIAADPANPGNSFFISKKQALLYGLFTRVGVSQIQLQYRIPSIVQNVNDSFVLVNTDTNTGYEVVIPTGFYSGATLAAAIQADVLALPGTPFPAFTCVYDATNGGLIMNCPTVHIALDPDGATLALPPTDAQVAIFQRTFVTIGGSFSNEPAQQPAPVFIMPLGTPQLLFTRYIDICSDRLTKYQRVKDADTLLTNKTNIIARIYLTAPNTRVDPSASGGPFDLTWDPNTIKFSTWSPGEAIYELDFRLYDEYGQLIPWSPGFNTEFQATILASET